MASKTYILGTGIRTESCLKKRQNDFLPLPHQSFLLNYFLNSPYNGMLLYHKLGSGKTCNSILIADEMIRSGKVKKVYVCTPGSLRKNFVQEYCKKCGLNYKDLHKNYIFITYNTNIFESVKNLDFNDSLVIIDEAHNLINGAKNISKNPHTLYNQVINSNAKVLVLTATVVFSNIAEWYLLASLLKKNTFPNLIKDKKYYPELFVEEEAFNKENVSGIISYFPGYTTDFPEIIYEEPIEVLMSPDQSLEFIDRIKKEDKTIQIGPPKPSEFLTDPIQAADKKKKYIMAKKRIISRSISNIDYRIIYKKYNIEYSNLEEDKIYDKIIQDDLLEEDEKEEKDVRGPEFSENVEEEIQKEKRKHNLEIFKRVETKESEREDERNQKELSELEISPDFDLGELSYQEKKKIIKNIINEYQNILKKNVTKRDVKEELNKLDIDIDKKELNQIIKEIIEEGEENEEENVKKDEEENSKTKYSEDFEEDDDVKDSEEKSKVNEDEDNEDEDNEDEDNEDEDNEDEDNEDEDNEDEEEVDNEEELQKKVKKSIIKESLKANEKVTYKDIFQDLEKLDIIIDKDEIKELIKEINKEIEEETENTEEEEKEIKKEIVRKILYQSKSNTIKVSVLIEKLNEINIIVDKNEILEIIKEIHEDIDEKRKKYVVKKRRNVPDKLEKDGGWVNKTVFENNFLAYVCPKIWAVVLNIQKHINTKQVVFSFYIEKGGLLFMQSLLKLYNIRAEIYSGDVSVEKREKILDLFNSEENQFGNIIQVLLTTEAGCEGITMTGVENVHLLETNTNTNKTIQCIGRAARYQSHINMPEDRKKVHIWRYYAQAVLNVKKEFNFDFLKKEDYYDYFVKEGCIKKLYEVYGSEAQIDHSLDETLDIRSQNQIKNYQIFYKQLQENSIENIHNILKEKIPEIIEKNNLKTNDIEKIREILNNQNIYTIDNEIEKIASEINKEENKLEEVESSIRNELQLVKREEENKEYDTEEDRVEIKIIIKNIINDYQKNNDDNIKLSYIQSELDKIGIIIDKNEIKKNVLEIAKEEETEEEDEE